MTIFNSGVVCAGVEHMVLVCLFREEAEWATISVGDLCDMGFEIGLADFGSEESFPCIPASEPWIWMREAPGGLGADVGISGWCFWIYDSVWSRRTLM
jgi:hypothetical protein